MGMNVHVAHFIQDCLTRHPKLPGLHKFSGMPVIPALGEQRQEGFETSLGYI